MPADLWAMGCTLYCLVRGRLPFEGDGVIELYENIQTKPVPLPQALDSDLKNLLARLLEKDPLKRLTLDEVRNHPWVTNRDSEPLISKEDNVQGYSWPTPEEIDNAVKRINNLFTVIHVANTWRRKTNESKKKSLSLSNSSSLPNPNSNSLVPPSPTLSQLAGKLDSSKRRAFSPPEPDLIEEDGDEDPGLENRPVFQAEPEDENSPVFQAEPEEENILQAEPEEEHVLQAEPEEEPVLFQSEPEEAEHTHPPIGTR